MKYAYIKNRFVKLRNANISIKERGFRYGDGIFETIKIQNYLLCDYQYHLARIKNGLQEIKISFNHNIIFDLANKLIKKNNQKNGFLRLSISRGIGSKGYYPLDCKATLIIETENRRKLPKGLINLTVSSYHKISPNMLPVNYKTMQGMNSILALIEARKQNYFDAVMLNINGHITETSSSNIFLLKKGQLYTPPSQAGLLCGVIREKIINNFTTIEKLITLDDLKEFDSLFITNVAISAQIINSISLENQLIWQNNPSPASNYKIIKIKMFLAHIMG